MNAAFATNHTRFRRDVCGLGGTIRLLEKDGAAPLEFIRSPVHLDGTYSPTVAHAG